MGIDRYYKRNVIGISGAEMLWGFGLPVVVESTFLQLFLKNLGASSFAVGLIPAFFFVGCSFFALISSYLTSNLERTRLPVILYHLISSSALLFFGSFLYVFGKVDYLLTVFFVSYAAFSICVGMTVPVWLNYLVKIFTEERAVSALGFMMIAQNAAKLFSSFVIVKVVEKHSFSTDAAGLIFIAVGVVFLVGSLFFLLTREEALERENPGKADRSFATYVRESVSHMLGNRNFLRFLAADMEFFVVVTVISFYANYAVTHCNIADSAAAGIFVTCIYIGAILTNVFMGSMGLFPLKQKYIISKVFSLSAVLLLVFFSTYWSFYLASLLLGAARGARMIVYAPSVKKLSGLPDATSYFAVGPILVIPFSVSLPLFSGYFLDTFSHLGADSYRILFGGAALLICCSLFFMMGIDYGNGESS